MLKFGSGFVNRIVHILTNHFALATDDNVVLLVVGTQAAFIGDIIRIAWLQEEIEIEFPTEETENIEQDRGIDHATIFKLRQNGLIQVQGLS